jgi:adenine-specific DNA-methyltransferase
LRANQLGGPHLRRQHPVGPYIVDFYCAQAKLAIEIDGRSHDERKRYDAERTRYLESLGMRVIRFTDDEILNNLEDVVRRIACEAGLES